MQVAIVVAQSYRPIKKQTFKCLDRTRGGDWKLFTKDGMEDGEMNTVNSLIDSIDIEWDYLVRMDDDMWLSPNWLKKMIKIYEKNKDVWLLGGCKYPTHKVLEVRKQCLIMDICPGNHWLISKERYEKVGRFYSNFIHGQAEDVRYCRKIKEMGGKVACLKDLTKVVHCGLVGTNGKGRSDYVTGYCQALADVVGAKCAK